MSRTSDLAIEVSHLAHRYERFQLQDISLSLAVGTTTALIGPDGVGKSTLLGLIAGTRRLQTGRILTLGADMSLRKERDRVSGRIAYMPQGLGRNLYPSLSVRENIEFFGRLFGQVASELAPRMERLLRTTGLDPFADRPAGKLSGGMKQKLSLCCALIHDPDLVVLDEPTTGIDPLSRREFWRLIRELRAERPSMTVVVATAYMEEAGQFESIIVMDEGRILASGPQQAVLERSGAPSLEEAFLVLRGDRQVPDDDIEPSHAVRTSQAPAIVAEHLTRRFGDFVAVDDVSFTIEQGEIFGFLGSNGCGKTTTMKMLTGLLPASGGTATMLGKPVGAGGIETRMRIGYMSQSFSLYEELSVRANLELHAHLYRIPSKEQAARLESALRDFDLADYADRMPTGLPLGIRQRLQLAAACLHRPDVLILDEPTSGVDPAARDQFWRVLRGLSRLNGVTIFISTHFMSEATRCDRISLMHAGKVLAVGTPAEIRASRQVPDLESAFIAYLEEADAALAAKPSASDAVPRRETVPGLTSGRPAWLQSFARTWAFALREMLELSRDRVRLSFALLGPLILMLTFGYGITFDVENLSYAVLDRDQSVESRRLMESFAGSRYFQEQEPMFQHAEIDRRLRSGALRVAIEIPPGFGRELVAGRRPEVGVFLDGAMPFRAETARGYVHGTIRDYANDLERRTHLVRTPAPQVDLEPRYRYNQDFRSVFAITPGCIMIILIVIPAMLTALGVVREREIGSISNLSASPASVGEYLIGKQAPYILLGFASFVSLIGLVWALFGVEVKGSLPALSLAALLYLFAGTGLGILVSTFVKTQIAAIIATAIICTVPAINFSGYLYPVGTVEGAGKFIGMAFPSLWFQNVSIGAFAKARDFSDFQSEYLVLLGFGIAYLTAAACLLRKQER